MEISIHALLAESDATKHDQATNTQRISIHALLAESDCPLFFSCWLLAYFYPRSPCGERQLQGFLLAQGHNFYPRSPCGERPPVRDIIQWEGIFLSTLSLRRATVFLVILIN